MSRPVIMRVKKHQVQQNEKATGSIEKEILRKSNVGEEIDEGEQYSSLNDLKSCSLVRSLINKYESTTTENKTLKYKSKSLVDLQKPKSTPELTTQDDYFLNRKKYKEDKDEDEAFDFKKVVSKFKTLERSSTKVTKTSPIFKNSFIKPEPPKSSADIGVIKQRAVSLLQSRPSFDQITRDSSWHNQVIKLLENISKIDSGEAIVLEPPTAHLQYFNEFNSHEKEVDAPELNGFNDEHVEVNNNSYLEGKRLLAKPVIIYADEDGVGGEDLQSEQQPITYENLTLEGNNEEVDDFSDSASSDTIQSVSPTFDQQTRIDYLESCKQLLNDLIKDVQDYELQITRLSSDDVEEGKNIKKVLNKILGELEDVKTDDEEVLINKKKEAVEYVHKCVGNLDQLNVQISNWNE